MYEQRFVDDGVRKLIRDIVKLPFGVIYKSQLIKMNIEYIIRFRWLFTTHKTS